MLRRSRRVTSARWREVLRLGLIIALPGFQGLRVIALSADPWRGFKHASSLKGLYFFLRGGSGFRFLGREEIFSATAAGCVPRR